MARLAGLKSSRSNKTLPPLFEVRSSRVAQLFSSRRLGSSRAIGLQQLVQCAYRGEKLVTSVGLVAGPLQGQAATLLDHSSEIDSSTVSPCACAHVCA